MENKHFLFLVAYEVLINIIIICLSLWRLIK